MSAVELHGRDRYSLKRTVRTLRRVPVRVDNTPLVDLAFLLLTFFMCGTVLTQPNVLEMALPVRSLVNPVITVSRATIYLRADGTARHRLDGGPLSGTEPVPAAAAWLAGESARPGIRLSLMLKVAPRAQHGQLVTLLDELDHAATRRAGASLPMYDIASMTTNELREAGTP